MSVCTATPIARPPQLALVIASASTIAREVVAPLPAVGLGLVEAEEAELAHAPEDGVREGRLLPFLRVGGELFEREAA